MANTKPLPTRRALLSVSDKRGLLPFAKELYALSYELVSTGGTANALREAGLPVTNVSDVTGFPEMLEGRVKTLHPAIHGGLLADRSKPEHMQAIAEHGIFPIDLVCVNLYPFAQVISNPSVHLEEAIENIDIGGPSMIRSAAKNHASVTVITDPADYKWVLEEMKEHGGETTLETRRKLAARAFAHTAQYDALISNWLSQQFELDGSGLPDIFVLAYRKALACRYGENPHQKAAFYVASGITEPCVSTAKQLHGKELSFNNLYDLNAVMETAKEFSEEPLAAAVIVKHTNPCGVALGSTPAEAFLRARDGDPISAFGGILALTRPVDREAAEAIAGKNNFFEAIIAPGYEPEAFNVLTQRKGWGADLRLLEVGDLREWRTKAASTGLDFKRVTGGVLAQTPDHLIVTAADLRVVTEKAPTAEEIEEMLFAWRVVRHVKSNAIVLSKGRQVVGVGAGQMNRVQSVRLAVAQAGEKAKGAVMASDAFFPFSDGPEAAAEAGVTAIIQPGGSKRDQDTIDLCNRYGIAMVYTGVRHFLH